MSKAGSACFQGGSGCESSRTAGRASRRASFTRPCSCFIPHSRHCENQENIPEQRRCLQRCLGQTRSLASRACGRVGKTDVNSTTQDTTEHEPGAVGTGALGARARMELRGAGGGGAGRAQGRVSGGERSQRRGPEAGEGRESEPCVCRRAGVASPPFGRFLRVSG